MRECRGFIYKNLLHRIQPNGLRRRVIGSETLIMQNLKKFGKKLFSMTVVSMTVAWSVGLSAFVPAGAAAATCPELEAGDLFKVSGNSAVYLVSSEMKRMYFPNAEVYNTWFKDFSGITTIESTCVDAYPSGGGVNFRPGSRLVKTPVSPTVYAVGPNNMKHKLPSEAVASALYGSEWNKLVRNLPDVFDSNYNVGAELTSAVLHNGQLVKKSGDSTVYYVWDSKLKKVDGSLPVQVAGDVRTVSESTFGTVSMDTATVTGSTLVANPSQKTGTTVPVPTPVPGAGATLKVSLSGATPAGTFAVKSAARVPFTKVVIQNTSAVDATIDSFKVIRGGSPAVNADFSTINVLDENNALLNDIGKTLNSDNMVTFTEDVVVKAGETRTLTLVGNMASGLTGGNVPTLGLYSLETPATVVASLPVYGNGVTTNANLALATVTLANDTTIGTVTKQVGSTNVNLARLKVQAPSEDVQVERVVLYNSGTSADGDIEKFVLKFNGNTVGQGTMKSKYLSFDLSNCGADCKVEKGNDRTYEVYADLTGGSGRTIDLDVQRAVHVSIKDLKNGYYVTPTNSADGMTNNVSVARGKLDVSKTNDVVTGNVASNSSNVSLATFNFKVTGEPIDVRTLVFRIATTGTVVPTGLDSVTLYNKAGKALIGGVDASGATSPGYATSTDSFTLPVGDNLLTLKAKIDNTAVANDTIIMSVDMTNSTNFDARGVNSGESITLSGAFATPNALVVGNTMTVKAAGLRATTLATPPSTTYAAGTNDVVLAKILLDSSESSEDIKVSKVTLNDVTFNGAKTINLQNIRLFVDKDGDSFNGAGTDVALSETYSGSDSTANNDDTAMTFNLSGNDQFIVKAGKKVQVTVKGNIAGGAATGTHTVSLNQSSGLTATGVTTGNSVSTITYDATGGQGVTVGTAGGTVEVSLDPGTQVAKQYAAGTKGVNLATFRFFVSSSEDVEVDKLNLTQVITDTASSSFKDFDMLYLYSGTTLVGSAAPTSTGVYFDLIDKGFVAKSTDTSGALLTVKGDLSSIGPSQNVTTGGHVIGFRIGSGAVTAKGALTGSTSVVYASSFPISGNSHLMFKSVPTVQVCSGTTDDASNCKAPNALLSNGSNDLIRFRVTANTSDLGLYKFTFDVTTTTATVTNVELLDVSETNEVSLSSNATSANSLNVITHAGSTVVVETLFDADSNGINAGGEERTVSAGTSKYFVLRGTVTGATTGASVSTRLAGDGTPLTSLVNSATAMGTATNVDAINPDDFVWSDRSAGSHATTTADWTNGYLVSGLNSASSTPTVVAK